MHFSLPESCGRPPFLVVSQFSSLALEAKVRRANNWQTADVPKETLAPSMQVSWWARGQSLWPAHIHSSSLQFQVLHWWIEDLCLPSEIALGKLSRLETWGWFIRDWTHVYLAFPCYCFVFWHSILLCSPDCPRTHSAVQATLRLTGICLPLFLLSTAVKGVCHHHLECPMSLLECDFSFYSEQHSPWVTVGYEKVVSSLIFPLYLRPAWIHWHSKESMKVESVSKYGVHICLSVSLLDFSSFSLLVLRARQSHQYLRGKTPLPVLSYRFWFF